MTTRKALGLLGLALPALLVLATLSIANADDRVELTLDLYRQLDGIPGAGIPELNVYLSHGIRVKHHSSRNERFAHGDLEVDQSSTRVDIDIDNDTPGIILGIETAQSWRGTYELLHVTFDPNCKNTRCSLVFADLGTGPERRFELMGVHPQREGMDVTGVDMLGDLFGWRKFEMYRDGDGYYYVERNFRGFAADYGTNKIVLEVSLKQMGRDEHRVVNAPGIQR